ncbi:restriction endonuclease subunit S [Arsenicitalea aurantiaca]|nr:restriction endonuclease subunit S [Arsenicitalea aurantiaca]
MESKVPETWEKTTFGQVSEARMGKTILSKELTEEGLPVFSAATENEVWGYTSDESVFFERGTIIISARGTIGAAKIPRFERFVSTQTTIAATPATELDTKYVAFQLSCVDWTKYTSTTAIPMLTISALSKLPIILAPINEQRRIVEKIETLFARLDKGEEALRDVQKLLARYRQSVLKAAVTGQLTADWRAENAHRLEHGRDLLARILQTRRETWDGRGKYQEPAAPETTELPELPKGWVWASVEQLANVMGGVTKNKKRQEMPLRKPMLRVANVYQNRLELEDIHQTSITEAESARVLLEELDLLVVEGNGSKDQIGRMAVWRNEIPDAVHQNHLIKVRMIEKGLVEFALWWFQSPNGRQNIEKVASSTSGLYTLSISKIEALVVPVPSLSEIDEINELVDEAFSKISHLEIWCQTELARSTALRQSILKDAFAGRLVPQDPADEPAAALLARIKETHAAAAGRTRRRIRT